MRQQARFYGYKCLLLFFSLLSPTFLPLAHAQQANQQRTFIAAEKAYQFHYQWLDQLETRRTLDFTLPETSIKHTFHQLRPMSMRRMNRLLVRPLTSYAQQQGWHQLKVSLSRNQSAPTYQANIKNHKDAQMRIKQMRQQEQLERQALLDENYLMYAALPLNQYGVIPDHPRIALASVDALAPVTRVFYDKLLGSTPRQYVETIASFVQAIPYSPLTSRQDSTGRGFSYPVDVLMNNRGDCDSKATLLTAIIRPMMPNIKMAVVYLPNHALLAIALNNNEGDAVITHEGVKFVLIEPTGPAQLKLGQLASTSAMYINSGNYTLKLIP